MPALAIRHSKFESSGSGGCQIGSSSNNGKRPYKHIIGIIQSLGFTPSLNDNQYHFNYHNIKSSQINILSKMGISLNIRENIITIKKPKEISACDIIVNHKTILSDHHPFFALMLSKAKDVSKIIEYVWKERFK